MFVPMVPVVYLFFNQWILNLYINDCVQNSDPTGLFLGSLPIFLSCYDDFHWYSDWIALFLMDLGIRATVQVDKDLV